MNTLKVILLLSTMILYTSLLFIHLTNPLSLGLTIMIMTILVSLVMAMTLNTSWFSFLLAMIFLTAMMIVFIYIASLAANEISSYVTHLLLAPMLIYFSYTMNNPSPGNYLNSSMDSTLSFSYQMIYKIYSFNTFILTIFLIIYLFLTLIVIVKNASLLNKPFRMHK